VQLLLIRHALPVRVEHEDGRSADPPLSEVGHGQTARMASWLADEPLDRIYSSPMRRAHQTALVLAETKGIEIELEPRLTELDRETDRYIPMEELKRTDYPAWTQFVRDGYPSGPELEQFQHNVVAGLEEIVASNSGRRVAVVCHAGVINIWAAFVLGLELRLFFHPDYTSLNRFVAARSGERSVESLNERAHLRGLEASS
jgi:probable phosphoglycerate mutase